MESRIVRVALDRIRPNPWQVRLHVDQEHIRELAADIAARGLLQMPIGRVMIGDRRPFVGPDGDLDSIFGKAHWTVQLAFGHNRLAAFRELLEGGNPEFATIPVRIQDLTDEQLATAAWAENVQRKDLSPIEEAQAIRRRMEDFGWTQERVAEELGLARATVANKLRLLRLPQEVQDRVEAGEVPERSAVALKAYYDLPEPLQASMRQTWNIRQILDYPGQYSSDEIRDTIKRATEHRIIDLGDANFALDEPLEGERIRQATCDGCPALYAKKGMKGCTDRRCFNARTERHWSSVLERASRDLGIPALGRGEHESTFTNNEEDQETLRLALERGCENLRLAVSSWDSSSWRTGPEGHPHIYYVCTKQGRYCQCRKEASAERIQAEKERQEELRQVWDPVVDRVVRAILDADVAALRAILAHFFRYASVERDKSLTRKDPEQIARAIARELLDDVRLQAGRSPEFMERYTKQWLQSRGFSTVDKDPLQEIRRKVERIRGFLVEQGGDATLVALEGNLQNLARLADELARMDGQVDPEARRQLLAEIGDVKEQVGLRVKGED